MIAPGLGSFPVATPCFLAFLIQSLAFHRQVTFLYLATKQVQFHQTKLRHHFTFLSDRV